MRDLRLVGVTDDGTRLVLNGAGEHFALPIDAALRAALRHDTGNHVIPGHHDDRPMSPVEVQALIRGGADAEEAAQRAGWTVEKVRRYEGPILAERAHVARIATTSRLRPRGPASGSPTLIDRVTRRLSERGVSIDDADWDSWRSDDAQWVVEIHFTDDGTPRHGSWSFDKTSHALHPLDHEAALLSEDDPDLIDSLTAGQGRASTPAASSHTALPARPDRVYVDEASDLMATLRSSSRATSRRRGARRPEVPTESLFPAVETPIIVDSSAASAETTAAPTPEPAAGAPRGSEASTPRQTPESGEIQASETSPVVATPAETPPGVGAAPAGDEVPEALEAAAAGAESTGGDSVDSVEPAPTAIPLPASQVPEAVGPAPSSSELPSLPSPEAVEGSPTPAALPAVEATPVPAPERGTAERPDASVTGERIGEQIMDAVIVDDAQDHPSTSATSQYDTTPEAAESSTPEVARTAPTGISDTGAQHLEAPEARVELETSDAGHDPETSQPDSTAATTAPGSHHPVPDVTTGQPVESTTTRAGRAIEHASTSARSATPTVETAPESAPAGNGGGVPGARDTTLPGESPALGAAEVDDASAVSPVPAGMTHVEPALSPDLEAGGSAQDAVSEAVSDITVTPDGERDTDAPDLPDAPATGSAQPSHEEPPLPFDVDSDLPGDSLPEVKAAAGSASGESGAISAESTRPQAPTAPTPAPSGRRRRRSGGSRGSEGAAPATPSASASTGSARSVRAPKPAPPAAAPAPQTESPTPAAKKASRSSSRRKGRASVPAWDDIMFGSKPGSDTDE